jgi:hypothetical protein
MRAWVSLRAGAVPAAIRLLRCSRSVCVRITGYYFFIMGTNIAHTNPGQSDHLSHGTNRKFLRAEQIEEQVWGFVRGLLRDPKRIRAGIDRLIEE